MAVSAQDIVKTGAAQFAEYLLAYKECSDEIQEIVNQMTIIVNDKEAPQDEKEHAVDVIVEALFPGITTDYVEGNRHLLKQGKDLTDAKEILDVQEKAFADKLKSLMDDRDMTQVDLAEATGVSQPAICNMLKRQCRPQQRTISRLAEVFEISPDELWSE